MKKVTLFSTIVVVAILFSGCKKKEEKPTEAGESFPTTKNALFLYYSGSQCNPCGSTGIPNYNNVLASTSSKAVPIVVHCNAPAYDSLYESQVGGELLSLIVSNGSYSAPTFLIAPNPKFSGSASGAANTAISQINTFASVAPDASSNIKASVSGGTLNVTTRTKFMKAVNGNYKIAVYVLEDGVIFEQLANGVKVKPYTHDDVLRARLTGSAYGDDLMNGAIEADKIFEKTFTRALPTGVSKLKTWNPSNLTIVAVVWKHTPNGSGTIVEVVNAQQIDL